MNKPYDTRLIMMVSQLPFETQEMYQFCKLIPIVYFDGTPAPESEFPNDGEVWWMLTAKTVALAKPGKLLSGMLENASRYREAESGSSQYQVQRESIRELDVKDGLVVVTIPSDAISSMQELVSGTFRLNLPAPPTAQVMLRWRGEIYGPFRATCDPATAALSAGLFSFAPLNVDMTVQQLSEQAFDAATHGNRVKVDRLVSLTSRRRSDEFHSHTVQHDLVLNGGYERIFEGGSRGLVLEPIERKLQRYAKNCFTRKKAKEFRALLEELEITGRETQDADELVDAVARIKLVTEKQDAALDAVAKALLQTGVLGEDRVRKAEQVAADKYVQDQAAQLQAKVQEAMTATSLELKQAQSALKSTQARLQKEESERRENHERTLAAEWQAAQVKMAAERAALENQQAELDRQQQALQKNLENVTKQLREAGDDVVNRFLTIAPLLNLVGFSSGQRVNETHNAPHEKPVTSAREFGIPSFVTNGRAAATESLSEGAFFERFSQLVQENGFVYRPLDLQRFHLSVKCGEMTVLGGPSGTGKSSLPGLYARALLGDDGESGRPGCLMVNVNPSWMDIRDLLGHMNTLEGKFYPAESGLFQHLVLAQEEHRLKAASMGLYMTCLDEMNLSQVEHYFSDFMMVLDRDDAARVIQCFSPEVASPSCQFRHFSRLRLPQGVKFVGTVNFDETTRLLSDRFLDRVNLIRLNSGSLPNVSEAAGDAEAKSNGRQVTLSDFDSWRSESALPEDLASLLDGMRPLLNLIGSPLSPRAYRGICRFVASATAILPTSMAFDVQIAQRIIPKVRGLVTKRQLQSLDSLLQLMSTSSVCSFEESVPLLEEVRDSAGVGLWELEE